jgi:hypothetical protein
MKPMRGKKKAGLYGSVRGRKRSVSFVHRIDMYTAKADM